MKTQLKAFLRNAGFLEVVDWYKSKRIKLVTVLLDNVRCQEASFSEVQGFSGKPIHFFPPCQFFRLSLDQPDEAHDEFVSWLHSCLFDLQAWKIPESEGGWRDGSLLREIRSVHHDRGISYGGFEDADVAIVNEVINQRVKYYFSVFDSIKAEGFDKASYPPIYCRLKDDKYYLLNGHHRTSALWALGYSEISVVIADSL